MKLKSYLSCFLLLMPLRSAEILVLLLTVLPLVPLLTGPLEQLWWSPILQPTPSSGLRWKFTGLFQCIHCCPNLNRVKNIRKSFNLKKSYSHDLPSTRAALTVVDSGELATTEDL